jgi:hypothetical protein
MYEQQYTEKQPPDQYQCYLGLTPGVYGIPDFGNIADDNRTDFLPVPCPLFPRVMGAIDTCHFCFASNTRCTSCHMGVRRQVRWQKTAK